MTPSRRTTSLAMFRAITGKVTHKQHGSDESVYRLCGYMPSWAHQVKRNRR